MTKSTVSTGVKEELRAQALSLGFSACGFTDAGPLDCRRLLEDWVHRGRHGDMDSLVRDPRARTHPAEVLAAAATVIVVGWPYPAAAPPDPSWRERLTGSIAAYALGTDYHEHMADKLERLAESLRSACGGATLVQVDGGPLMEKPLAERAGLGWLGHNTLLLTRDAGSYLMLGCLLTTVEFEPDPHWDEARCGPCRACLPACPTGALQEGETIDAGLCLSYLTIEHRGPIDRRLRPLLGNWVFGCDLCQTACPQNGTGVRSPELEPFLPALLEMCRDDFRAVYARTALRRIKRRGLARNAAVALGNSGNSAAVEPLAGALRGHDEPLVRAHAAWGLGQLACSGQRAATTDIARFQLESALRTEPVPPVRAEIQRAIEDLGTPGRS